MARLLEHQGKGLFAAAGMQIPEGILAESHDEAKAAADRLRGPVVLKCQVPTGKRGLVGGVRFAETADDAAELAKEMLGSTVYSYSVDRLLVERRVELSAEYYMAVFSNQSSRGPTLLFSTKGGADVEQTGAAGSALVTLEIDILDGLRLHDALDALRVADIPRHLLPALAQMAVRLYRVYRQRDCILAEINPLGVSGNELIVADARIEIDDDALGRQRDLGIAPGQEVGERLPTSFERIAALIDTDDHRGSAHFVQIDPTGTLANEKGRVSVGFAGIGTGVSLTAMDELVEHGFQPKNFCDTSGNPTGSKLYRATRVILSQPGIEGFVFASCLSSQQLDNTARGIIKAFLELFPDGQPTIPTVLSFRGAWDETAISLFERHNISSARWIRILGRDTTERDLARELVGLHAAWRARMGAPQ